MKKKIKQPLDGINVLDLTRVLAGPKSTDRRRFKEPWASLS